MDKIDTPRTDGMEWAVADECRTKGDDVRNWLMQARARTLARTLERELSAALARVAELEGALRELHRFAFAQHGLSSAWVKPLNQARDALKEKS